MRPWRLVQTALSAAFVCAAGATSAAAQQQGQPRCALGEARAAAERATAVYDGPGGSKIGYLAPGAKYFVVDSRGRSASDRWHLLVAPGGAHVGWVWSLDAINFKEGGCRRVLPPLDFGLELLYGAPKK